MASTQQRSDPWKDTERYSQTFNRQCFEWARKEKDERGQSLECLPPSGKRSEKYHRSKCPHCHSRKVTYGHGEAGVVLFAEERHVGLVGDKAQRIRLEEFQKVVLREMTRKDEDGLFVYRIWIFSAVKKTGKCLALDTDVQLADGTVAVASAIRLGDYVLAYRDGYLIPARVRAVELQPPELLWKVVTARGRVLTTTANHPYLVRGSKLPPSLDSQLQRNPGSASDRWVYASDLQVGDRVVVALGGSREKVAIPLDPSEAYVMGAFVGDGSGCRITNNTSEIWERIERVFSTGRAHLPLGSSLPSGMPRNCYQLHGAKAWLEHHGLAFCTAHNKRIPQAVFRGGAHAHAAFLSGYLDTDGTIGLPGRPPVVEWNSVNRELLVGCQHLLAGLGVNAKLALKHGRYLGCRHVSWRLSVQGYAQMRRLWEVLDVAHPSKRSRLEAYSQRPCPHGADTFTTDRVRKVQPVKVAPTVAIEVEDVGTHVTSGLVTHNSEIGGMLGAWGAITMGEYNEIYFAANSRDQAAARTFAVAARSFTKDDVLRRQYKARVLASEIRLSGLHTTLRAASSDWGVSAGVNPGMVIWDELWAFTTEGDKRLYAELAPSPSRANSITVVVTYAGFENESELLWDLYLKGVGPEEHEKGQGHKRWHDVDLPIYVNETIFCYWDHVPRMPWHTKKWLDGERARTPGVAAYLRQYENRWVTSTNAFVTEAQYNAVEQKDLCALAPTRDVTLSVGVDLAYKHDCAAVVAVCRDEETGRVRVAQHQIWTPTPENPLDIEETVEAYLQDLYAHYRLKGIWYDPFQMARSAQTLTKKGLPMIEFNQTDVNMIPATNLLWRAIVQGRLVVYAAPDLREHVLNAVAVQKERGQRLTKEKVDRKIDGAIALAEAIYGLEEDSGVDSDFAFGAL